MNLQIAMPEIILLATIILVVIVDLFAKNKVIITILSLLGIGASAIAVFTSQPAEATLAFNGMLASDGFAAFFRVLFLGIAALLILSSNDYTHKFKYFRGEYHALIMLATLGMMLMSAATDLISVYLAVEITAISFYILVGFLKDKKSTESSLKYLLIGGVASAVLLYGFALVYGTTGATSLSEIASVISGMSISSFADSPALLLGLVLLVAGFGFKIAAVPFQFWVPDVYEGAPTTITMFLSVGSKAAGFAIITRLFFAIFSSPEELGMEWGLIIAVISAIGMTLGNLSAIPQKNIKRMLGFSSIAHAGYILVGLAAVGMNAGSGETIGQSSILFYLVALVVTDMAAFIAIIAITNKVGSDLIKDFSGMGRRAPMLALALTLALISLTGFPPTAGFIAKFYVFAAGVSSDLLWLVVIGVINSVISAYYYVNVIKVMWLGKPESDEAVPSSFPLRLSLGISCALILALGIVPALLFDLADRASGMIIF